MLNFLQASIQGRHSVVPKTEIDIQFGDVEVEVDLTMIDRLHGVLYPSSSSADQPKPASHYFGSAPLHTDAVSIRSPFAPDVFRTYKQRVEYLLKSSPQSLLKISIFSVLF